MSLAKLPRKRLLAMRAAGNEVLDCYGKARRETCGGQTCGGKARGESKAQLR